MDATGTLESDVGKAAPQLVLYLQGLTQSESAAQFQESKDPQDPKLQRPIGVNGACGDPSRPCKSAPNAPSPPPQVLIN
jgi:hypothetical protein